MAVQDLQKIVIKLFAQDPKAASPETIVPIFHRWIQNHSVEGLLIDVGDYGHLPNSSGAVLIGHDADYFVDSMEGPPGLLYNRKGALPGTLAERIRACYTAARTAAAKLEEEPEVEGWLKFKPGEARLIANDRLLAPNTEEAFRALKPEIEAALKPVLGDRLTLSRDASDPRSRLTIHVRAG